MKKLKTILCGAVAAGVIAVGIAPFIWAKQDAVIPGMRLNGQNVGGMTREDLSQLLKKKNQDLAHKKIRLSHGSVKEEWPMADLKVHYDESKIDDMLSLGKSGHIFSDWLVRWKTLLSGNIEQSPILYDRTILKEKAAALAEKYSQPAEDAKPVLEPGAGFSYNNTTGTRSPDHGYLEAPVIIDGKLEPGYGGGVCQTSTTLFNAVMLAGLSVTERTSHFSPVAYVPIGQDATVSFGDLDFCFTNSFQNPIYVYVAYAPGEITCYILGDRTDKPQQSEILLQHSGSIPFKTIEKVDSSQKEEKTIEYGHEGYSAGILQYARWADGRIYQDTFESYYEPVDTVITYNKDPKKQETEKNKEKSKEIEKTAQEKQKNKEEMAGEINCLVHIYLNGKEVGDQVFPVKIENVPLPEEELKEIVAAENKGEEEMPLPEDVEERESGAFNLPSPEDIRSALATVPSEIKEEKKKMPDAYAPIQGLPELTSVLPEAAFAVRKKNTSDNQIFIGKGKIKGKYRCGSP